MQTISHLLTISQGPLKEMLNHSQKLLELTRLIKTILPDYLAPYCTVAAWENDKITIHVNNASAGTFLRYQVAKIGLLLKTHYAFKSIEDIIIHIRPTTEQKNAKKFNPKSIQASELLRETAANMNDSEVKSALVRLANTLNQGKKS